MGLTRRKGNGKGCIDEFGSRKGLKKGVEELNEVGLKANGGPVRLSNLNRQDWKSIMVLQNGRIESNRRVIQRIAG